MKHGDYQPRTYRQWVESEDLVSFNVVVEETDLLILARANLGSKARRLVLKYRQQLKGYIHRNPTFLTSLKQIPVTPDAPAIARMMIAAGEKAGVGPMAAVAGAIAELTGKELLRFSPEIIVENGGDIFLRTLRQRTVGIYAGNSPLTGRLGIEVEADSSPLGICTSSGTVGHSLSFGQADAVTVLARSAALADACATAIGNRVKTPSDIEPAIGFAQSIAGLDGLVIIIGEKVGAWGKVKLCEISR